MDRKTQLFDYFLICLQTPDILYRVKMYEPEIRSILTEDDLKTFNLLYSRVDYQSEKYNPIRYNISRLRNFLVKIKPAYCKEEQHG